MLNEYAAKKLGFRSPQDAVGKVVRGELFDPGTGMVDINIIGVVGDTRFRSVRDADRPNHVRKISIRARPELIIRYRGDPATVAAADRDGSGSDQQ